MPESLIDDAPNDDTPADPPAGGGGETPPSDPPASPPAGDDKSGRPEHVPEKFWDPESGGLRTEALLKSYTELEKNRVNPDKLKEEWEQERLANRPDTPDAYELPDDDRFDKEALEQSPIVQLWRGIAHDSGMDQEAFQKRLGDYAEMVQEQQSKQLEAEREKLGDTADDRVQAASAFARKVFDAQSEEFEAIRQLGSTAAGVAVIERFQQLLKESGATLPGGNEPPSEDTEEAIMKLMDSPQYYDPARREQAVVDRVQKYYQRKHGQK